MNKLTKLALTATLGLAITLTLNACEEKEKKQTASESQPSGEESCPKEGPPTTIEATFLENDDSDSEGLAYSDYRLANGDKIKLNGFAPDEVKKGDKVSVTYKKTYSYGNFGDGDRCYDFKTIISVKKTGTAPQAEEAAKAKADADAAAAKAKAEAEAAAGAKGSFTDTRDNKTYKTAKIGTQVWMAENLNFEAKEGSMCYDNKPDNCKKYGRLYNWEIAKNACPSGWKLPSNEEWNKLTEVVGGENNAGKYLKAKSGWNENGNGEDKFGFSALPGGFGDSEGENKVGENGSWWISSEGGSYNAFREIFSYNDIFGRNYDDLDGLLRSVRCIQN